MEATTWSLWVRGRIRTTIELADGGDEALAVLQPRTGLIRDTSAMRAEHRDGRRWEVSRDDGRIEVRGDGLVHARVEDDVLTAGGRTFRWRVPSDRSRTASVRTEDGVRILDVVPGDGRDAPWAVIVFSPDLPSPFAVVLAACFALVDADARDANVTAGLIGGP